MKVKINSGLDKITRQKLATVVNYLNTGKYNTTQKVENLLRDYQLDFDREYTIFYIKERFHGLRYKKAAEIWMN